MNQKKVDYATPVWRCKSVYKSPMRTLGFIVGMLGICLAGALVAVSFLSWVGIIVW
jgi:hypothetical protein